MVGPNVWAKFCECCSLEQQKDMANSFALLPYLEDITDIIKNLWFVSSKSTDPCSSISPFTVSVFLSLAHAPDLELAKAEMQKNLKYQRHERDLWMVPSSNSITD